MRSRKQALLTRAVEHQRVGEMAQAYAVYQDYVRADPFHVDAWNQLGILAYQLGKPEAALEHFGRALGIAAPEAVAALRSNRAAVLQSVGRHAEAEAEYREALQLNPLHAEAHSNLGNFLRDLGRYAESEICCRRAVELLPGNPEVHNNLGSTLRDLGRYDEAEAYHRRALELVPDYPDAHYNLALVLLVKGEMATGWPEYEWRLKIAGHRPPALPQPLWDGSTLEGKTMLVHPEQGFGDTIQFVRYAAKLKERGATVLLRCSQALADVLRTCPGVDQIIAADATLPAFDVHTPLLSLPRLFETTLSSIPAAESYLTPDPERVDDWRQRLSAVPGFRVGIVWKGNPRHVKDRQRSASLRHFLPLAQVPGVSLVSLQVGAGHAELADVPRIMDAGSQFDPVSFNDVAAAVRTVDLVGTVDTAIAHLAGALGVPVWVALPQVPDWRWLLEREDSPWYPTLRLFRQRRLGDWDEVFARIASELGMLCRRSQSGA